MDYRSILVFLAFLINLFLSLLVYFRAKKTPANIALIVTGFGITAWCLAMVLFRIADSESSVLWAKMLYYFPVFTPTAFLLFGLYFPNDKPNKKVVWAIVLATFAMVNITILDGTVIKDVIINLGHEKRIVFGWAYYWLYSVYFPVFFISSYYVWFKKYRKANPFLKMQILYILLGMSAASLPAMVTNLNMPTFGYFELNWVGQLFTVFWIGGMAYAIVKHRLLNIRLVVARAIAYVLLLGILGFIYALGIFISANFFFPQYRDSNYLLVSALFALFIAFTFQPLKNFLEKITDSVFFKEKYISNELILNLTRTMAATIALENLTRVTLVQLLNVMRVSQGMFIIFKENDDYFVIHEGYKSEPDFDLKELKEIFSMRRICLLDDEVNEKKKELMGKLEVSIVLPLFKDNHKEGLLLLGDKKSGDFYSQQDIEVLEIFGPEISVAIQNAKAYSEISKFNSTLREEVDKATKDLKVANDKLKELDKMKDEFVSLASHELRTPMTAIKSYLWMALEGKGGPLTEKQKYYLDRSYSSTDRLIKLVNDMLNISRIESGRITIKLQEVDIQKLTQEVIDEVMSRAQELGVALEVVSEKSLPKVSADPDKIKEVLINFIGNSLKFTPKDGTISISFSQANGMVETRVKDTGVGIPAEEMPKLFQKFGLLPGSYTVNRTASGTGLGLYITKSIVELHKGDIWAHSEGRGKGSEFGFSLKVFNQEDVSMFRKTSKEEIGLIHTKI